MNEHLSALMKDLRVFSQCVLLLLLTMAGANVYAGEPISYELAIIAYSLALIVDIDYGDGQALFPIIARECGKSLGWISG